MTAEGNNIRALMAAQPGYLDAIFFGSPKTRQTGSLSIWNSEAELDAADAILKPHHNALYNNGHIVRPAQIHKYVQLP